MSTYGLAASRYRFVLVTPENHVVARAARTELGLAAMLAQPTRAPPLRLALQERLLRELATSARVLGAHELWIVPDGLVESLHAVAGRRRRSPRATALILARAAFADWFACDIRRRGPGSDRQIQLF